MKIDTIKKLSSFLGENIDLDAVIEGFSVDSRDLKPGQVFCALKGEKLDGHLFLDEAKQRGACLAIVEKTFQGKSSLPLIAVDNVLKTLQDLTKKILALRKVSIIGVTGSVGKTSCKDFIFDLLKKTFSVGKSLGTQNSQVGLPLTILNDTSGLEEWLVLEMGMTEQGQIKRLVEMAPPKIALVTQVALVHSVNFDSLEKIAEAKAEIFSDPNTRVGILPLDFESLTHTNLPKKKTFSTSSKLADYYLDRKGEEFFLCSPEEIFGPLALPSLGDHHHGNILAAISVALEMGVSKEVIREILPSLKLPERRFQFMEKEGILFVNDSFNASEISVKAALKNLPEPKKGGKKIAVLGSMLELGKFSEECHKNVGIEALKRVNSLYCFGKECLPMVEIFRQGGGKADLFEELPSLINALKIDLKEGDVVLLKGSRSKQLWKVLEEF